MVNSVDLILISVCGKGCGVAVVTSYGYATFRSGQFGLNRFGLVHFGLGSFGLGTFRSNYEILQKFYMFTFNANILKSTRSLI